MRFPLFRRSGSQDLTTSQLFNEKTFYQKFLKDITYCRSELVIESPFITTRRLSSLLPTLERLVRRGVKVTINTRPPMEHEDYLRSEAEAALSVLNRAGVTILLTGGHHRKVAIIDRTVLWEGSLNILSYNQSCEIMRRISSPKIAQDMIRFIGIERHI
ncbi:MAG TPA: phospholipase D-like domain-containing protein [Candidatus Saccharimonadales bacterium]|nr:phospholipase D-like domain-containing protein [Candidatus Saccharimonadales bacterium]